MNQHEYFAMSNSDRAQYDAQQKANCGMNSQLNRQMMDVNASTETAYPVKNSNSMNKKLEAAKKWLKDRK